MEQKIWSRAPILCEQPQLLLLGSMPSVSSLTKQQYYGHPRNHFWPLIACVCMEDDPIDYEERLHMLRRHKILLWDSIESCVRTGSLDQNIRDVVPNGVDTLIRANPTLQAVAFNGTMSQKVFDRYFTRTECLRYLLLPSSSPVPRRDIRNFSDKLPGWLELQRYIVV